MAKRLTLTEFRTTARVPLSTVERDALRTLHRGMRVEPSIGAEGLYDLTPDQYIGLIALPNVEIEIRPKVPMSSVLFLVSYACDSAHWKETTPALSENDGLVELLAIMLARAVEHSTRRGLLSGYRTEEEAVQVPRGRILFGEQIRRRYGVAPPIEVSHDLYTPDILENRLLLAALAALGSMPLRSNVARRELSRAGRLFGAVSRVRFYPASVPEVVFNRLNSHYEPAIRLASLVLRSASVELGAGLTSGSAFLIDMNKVFETFVRTALREALGVTRREFPDRSPPLALDAAGKITLKPDLSLLEGQRIVWLGDAKYKRLPAGTYQNADVYQMLAYAIAAGLPGGTLVYAADEGIHSAEHWLQAVQKHIRVIALDLSAPPHLLLRQTEVLAGRIGRPCSTSAIAL